jgi:hypothetical protein
MPEKDQSNSTLSSVYDFTKLRPDSEVQSLVASESSVCVCANLLNSHN